MQRVNPLVQDENALFCDACVATNPLVSLLAHIP